ncbi:MAG: transketolase [Gammaproteobacteria bacterium]
MPPTRRQLANAIRALSMDAVQKANSGHPGMPMGMADIAEVLWNDLLRHNPANPHWINRDRFILSNGHGCMLQYALLHLTGYDLNIEDIKQFRQLHSRTPGHPEYGLTPGVEATTGPLGQGIADGIGMAIAEKVLAAHFNRDDNHLIDHYTYVFMGDGCMMEGISHEACSLAGTLGLGKLIAFWDDNGISIDGPVEGWFTENVPQRFTAYGWHVLQVDGHDTTQVRQAIIAAREVHDRPSLICCKTTIGFGAPHLAGSEKTHGAPLGAEEVAAARKQLDWAYPPFVVPENIYAAYDARAKGQKYEEKWQHQLAAYQKKYPELAAEFLRRVAGELPQNWQEETERFIAKEVAYRQDQATRKSSQDCLNAYGPLLPELIGGSADLTGSNYTDWKGSVVLSRTVANANYIHYGVREFAMFAIMNGIALHGGFIPYGGTFLTFVDYGRNAVRLSALMKQRVIFVFTHDSIGLGEDGPTHQPIEHAAMLRLTPQLSVWRPCDALETAVAWKLAIERQHQPTCLLLSRQNLPQQMHSTEEITQIARGGYVLRNSAGTPQAIIIAAGSEVSLATTAADKLAEQGYDVRVVSMPSTDTFDAQSADYRESVLPSNVTARVAVEAGAIGFWYKYVGIAGKVLGLNRYGESAPYKDIYQALGLTVENIIQAVKSLLD